MQVPNTSWLGYCSYAKTCFGNQGGYELKFLKIKAIKFAFISKLSIFNLPVLDFVHVIDTELVHAAFKGVFDLEKTHFASLPLSCGEKQVPSSKC